MTFQRRSQTPPVSWVAPYAALAAEDRLDWPTLGDVASAAQAFLDPVLAGTLDGTWRPDEWAWKPR